MSNGVHTSEFGVRLLLGQVANVSLRIRSSHACQMLRTLTFPTARSFIPASANNKAAFRDLLTRLTIGGVLNRLLITGHTDSAGGSTAEGRSGNQALSERRTQAVDAVLSNNPGIWEGFFNPEGWGDPELTAMATEIGVTDVAPFRAPAARIGPTGLYSRYFSRLLGGVTAPSITRTSPAVLGCGQQHLLRGNRGSPSRDATLPPIEGKFEPNRRVEFFFFDSSSSTIACSEYPTWTALCSLTPPPPPVIAVTIASLETVRRGSNVDVAVTLTPSPLPFGTQVTLTLSATSGTGEARFVSSSSTTLNITASGPVTIRGVTASSGVDNIRLSASVAGQSAVLAQEDFTVVEAISIFLQFEVWNLGTNRFDPLPAGVDVDLRDKDPGLNPNDLITTRATNADGRVFFNLPDLSASGEATPDIFFLVHTNGLKHAGHTLKDEWSTSGWLAADNTTPGLIPNYAGTPIGTPSAPVIFRIGLDLHARVEYQNLRPTFNIPPGAAFDARAPEGFRVGLRRGIGSQADLAILHTNADGEVHTVMFDIEAEDTIFFFIPFVIADDNINLPSASVRMTQTDQFGWSTSLKDADQKIFPENRLTSLGTKATPEIIRCTVNDRNLALYMLKVLREWSIFLFKITKGEWKGVDGLTLFRTAAAGRPYSWPVGSVNVPPDLGECGFRPTSTAGIPEQWCRATLIHEMSHQIMWQESHISTLDIALMFAGPYKNDHSERLATNQLTALWEGWAEFIEAIFEASRTPPSQILTNATTGAREVFVGSPRTRQPFDTPLNFGNQIEGAFLNGLYGIFANQVVTPVVAANPHVPETANGNILTPAVSAWLTKPAVQDRFLKMIWRPLQNLRKLPIADLKTTVTMIFFIRQENLTTDWHRIQAELQAFNIAMTAPTLSKISPNAGPPTGRTPRVTITGEEFTFGTTTVTIGGNAAGNVEVKSSTTLLVDPPPGAVGPADVVVKTPAGTASLLGKFIYAVPPVVTDLFPAGTGPGTPARGETNGGTNVTIVGTGFHPNARVFFGGLPPAGVEVVPNTNPSATSIDLNTPLFPLPAHRPGPTEVIVQNPDLQTGRLAAAFDYFLGPAPSIIGASPQSGPASSDTEITIDGSNFVLNQIEVFIDGRQVSIDLGQSSPSQILTIAQALSTGIALPHAADIRIRNRDGQEANVPGGFVYTP